MWSVVLGPKVLVRITLLHLNRKASCALFLALVIRFRFSRTRVQVRSPFEWLRSVKKNDEVSKQKELNPAKKRRIHSFPKPGASYAQGPELTRRPSQHTHTKESLAALVNRINPMGRQKICFSPSLLLVKDHQLLSHGWCVVLLHALPQQRSARNG